MKLPALAIALSLIAAPAFAACKASSAGFADWLDGVRSEALSAGISAAAVDEGLSGIQYDASVIKKDRGQGVFSQTFLQFSSRMVAGYRLTGGAQNIKKNKDLFARIEADYGVPAPVIVAVWGLESDFGANTGDFNTIQSLATLAFDCRRPDRFRPEVFDALRILERGDLTVDQMRGAWAGELGQTQFLSSNYYKYGVDYDGDGRRDLIKSRADALASTANYLHSLGWHPGEPWLVEVDIPSDLPWAEAHLAVKKPVSDWVGMGVSGAHGDIPDGNAALYLPMGRFGPAFLAYRNFDVYLGWNESLVYTTTAAYYATRLSGAPAVGNGNGTVEVLGADAIKAVQTAIKARGQDPGPLDGKLGSKTREAVRAVQIDLGLPADGWPDSKLLSALGN